MNKKEVKQLTKGCTVLVKATVESVQETKAYVHHGCITHPLPFSEIYSVPTQPKYDPCRLFRYGDKVTPRLVNGRDFNSLAEEYRGKILTVTRDEEKYDNVFVEYGGDEFTIDPAYLQLVTPVEELEPYSVHESEVIQGFDIVRDKLCVMTFPFGEKENGWYYNRLAAKVAADAECARLNAEHRKECNNA